ncbi:MAG: hypothetical protein US04_C0001G0475 [Candidatus Nomurabacteria bacterium GW2011_GWD2_36_14]|nr:MAG: hypothetical protein UR97_C0002G0105 [Candidatus Nomurabacteria bacterium GW2011_GWE2_36_115]KKP94510.1 MAG: hypothetical protein US00_C0001G0104 [Candidatus Nomurabacteria bacterium GW2011_GWF2_36_126]KKP96972.1 MAG: hypothetical protein US04_C0001G0475 [Candidatus Nomurabacteria bacterium GW2011_GWD2_36_14]KKP99424.1 MAG: hypothetical protein US08_C0001G0106 [Candidatus Nomurabacteria bacterium GW2011_GWF2_36_19]KKQ05720.1 MAG: hypothetical protein US17_C0002G0104 [Candidatus Nomuraba
MEPCQSGLTYIFAKDAGDKTPRWFESSRLRRKYGILNVWKILKKISLLL